uniref:Uncharacterized protein n=1 Tax=Rangifer tarandus platyrhynchus TaxID=3082113 RepID=A0ACB0FDT2_RANTA|nr:unnamed protein product [Rangifer tarandus platyrhynchus]
MNKQPIARDYAGQLDTWTAKIRPVPAPHSAQTSAHGSSYERGCPSPLLAQPLWLLVTAPSPPHVLGVYLWTAVLPVGTESSAVQR